MEIGGKVAVVTGAGSGIGAGMCRAFAGAGMKVVVSDVDRTSAEKVAAEISAAGGNAVAVAADVAQRSQVEELAWRALDQMGTVDVVCNNAGVLVGGPMLETTEDDWRWLLDVNVMGVVHGCSVFAPLLLERGGGHIVNTASVGGFLSYPNLATYCTTKFAVVGFTESLHQELSPRGVGVSVLCPGKVHSNLSAADRLRPAQFAEAGGSSRELGDLSDGMQPIEVGRRVIHGIENGALYIFTHPEFRELVDARFAAVLSAFGGTGD